jgi:uncharacterized protein Usg
MGLPPPVFSIIYRITRACCQSYIWQDYDLAPNFPILIKFLAFWREKLDGPLHSVVVGHSKLIKPAEIKTLDGEFWLQ